MLQKCEVLRLFPAGKVQISQSVTDCDSQPGVSASRVFVRKAGAPEQLIAVGMWTRANEMGGGLADLPADPAHNSSVILVTSEAYSLRVHGRRSC